MTLISKCSANKLYKTKFCNYCGKKLSLKNKWYYVNDNIYCCLVESNYAFLSLKIS